MLVILVKEAAFIGGKVNKACIARFIMPGSVSRGNNIVNLSKSESD